MPLTGVFMVAPWHVSWAIDNDIHLERSWDTPSPFDTLGNAMTSWNIYNDFHTVYTMV